MNPITSPDNPKVKAALRLQDRRDREKSQTFLIEGYRETLRAIEGEQPLSQLFVCEELFLGSNEAALIASAQAQGADIFTVPEKIFRKLSYRDRPDGILAVAPQRHLSLKDLPLRSPRLLLVAESIEKPGNLGTILRSCDAAGVDACILADRTTDLHNPNVVRASVGTLFTLPVIEADAEETFSFLKREKIAIVAATPHAILPYTEADLRGDIAIVVGTEQLGLSPRWMEGADLKVKIPMRGKADSLNVATATTLLLFEALRQRS
jgi:TrmH family RNA methyltransferase